MAEKDEKVELFIVLLSVSPLARVEVVMVVQEEPFQYSNDGVMEKGVAALGSVSGSRASYEIDTVPLEFWLDETFFTSGAILNTEIDGN